jgi:HlyD family secretion protein
MIISYRRTVSELQKARITYNNAKIEKERFEQLFKEKVVAEKEYHEYLLSFNKANADLEEAENTLQLVKVGASAQSGIAANEVRSTVDGVLLDVPAKEGNFVIERNTFNEGTTIATIADMNDMIFTGKVEEADVNRLKPGMDLAITVRATEEKTYHARLEFISPNGVKEEGATTFEVRAAITLDSTQFLRAGYSATADIVLEKRDNVLCVRESVVRFEQEKPYVEVEVQPQTFEKRYVQLGLSDEINIQVLSGVKPNDRLKAVF